MVDTIYHPLVYILGDEATCISWFFVDVGLGFGSPNQLKDFCEKIKIRAYFLKEEEDHMWIS